jgi:hypothetical protein
MAKPKKSKLRLGAIAATFSPSFHPSRSTKEKFTHEFFVFSNNMTLIESLGMTMTQGKIGGVETETTKEYIPGKTEKSDMYRVSKDVLDRVASKFPKSEYLFFTKKAKDGPLYYYKTDKQKKAAKDAQAAKDAKARKALKKTQVVTTPGGATYELKH